ncbi:unnamed protein product [Lepeophtheirus salmonis]|uniref:(salmon louse) hypothetical protein n=1 Tax=Lepeophtheirus salmonis TaxID=72036 RepID=A0A7R8CNH6_LEPSM|nr:unnamed protein product [Lepeophtheirus salmonis]CAF2875260.1 unnamed protein product [Lepeophtheirus salmonis]
MFYFGCCPACVKYLDIGDDCELEKNWSKQKLLSETTELECSKSEERVLKKEFLESKYSNDMLVTRMYCSDVKGRKISGAYDHISPDGKSSTGCLCSRKKDEMMKIGKTNLDSSLHCSTDVLLQLCFEVGTMYLRRCESRIINKVKTEAILQKHGHYWRQPYITDCEYNGSFGPIRCSVESEKICRCTDPYGKQIKSYFASISAGQMDCRCALDEYYGHTNQQCANHFGGYKELQEGIGEEWCIDEDGFQWSMSVMQSPAPGKRCKIPNCEESESNCRGNCVDCSKCGQCEQGHDECLRKVINHMIQNNVKLNKEKCVNGKGEKVIGLSISIEGGFPDSGRIEDLKREKLQGKANGVRSFFGRINQLSTFISHITSKRDSLRELLRKNWDFKFGEEQQRCAYEIQKEVHKEPCKIL